MVGFVSLKMNLKLEHYVDNDYLKMDLISVLTPPLIDNAHLELSDQQRTRFEQFKDENIPDSFDDFADFFQQLKQDHLDIWQKLRESAKFAQWLQLHEHKGEASQFATKYANMFRSSLNRYADNTNGLIDKMLVYGKNKWAVIEDEDARQLFRSLMPEMVKAFESYDGGHKSFRAFKI